MKIELRRYLMMLLAAIMSLSFAACSDDDNNDDNDDNDPDEETVEIEFARGADVSWLTEMEDQGWKFYDANGKETECMTLLKSMGVNSIRLRVWVDPSDGYCNRADVLKKALRAKNLGLPVMIDFHYSDSWADPSKQNVPSAWSGHTLTQLIEDVKTHTTDVLSTLKRNGVDVQWVQVGNETNWGMLWETGKILNNDFTNFALLINAGYDAVKSIYSDAEVIVHTSNGHDWSLLKWMYDGLQLKGAKYDVIGLSLYPEDDQWETQTQQCLDNIKNLITLYDKDVMVCEVGTSWDATYAKDFMTKLVNGCKVIDDCEGVFYWEPQCYNSWEGYTKGAFDTNGKPTDALDAFNSSNFGSYIPI